MTPDRQKQILIDYLNMKVLQQDWRSVEDTARDLRDFRAMATERPITATSDKVVPPAAIPPVEIDIPHHANEVVSLLRMNDADLVDRMFPDYTQEGDANAN